MNPSNYDLRPKVKLTGYDGEVSSGFPEIGSAIARQTASLGKSRIVVAVECYPGVIDKELLPALEKELKPVATLRAADANLPETQVKGMLARDLTDDRVRGFMGHWQMHEFFDPAKLDDLAGKTAAAPDGLVLIYGTGASLVAEPDVLVYADLARWEIQLRYRRGDIGNFCVNNHGEDFLRMYKQGYFVDWRVADRLKQQLFEKIDFLLDTNRADDPQMISGVVFRKALCETAQRPFRTVPYFDSGPWGGQWMKEVCGLDPEMPNYAWCFDGVPEENSLLLDFDGKVVEIPSINVVLYQPNELLGDTVHSRFGREFPIRFDLLDTIDGGNLSLQVHPTTEYIREQFGMPYTQDESYYMLDAGDDAVVYLGTKTGISTTEMFEELELAEAGGCSFDANKFINVIPAKKHDHFLIPAGLIHCSGKNSIVLEISATPYIFTFKLWDWDRVGIDGKPRPIHLDHGREVIRTDWNTEVVEHHHVNCVKTVAQGDGWREERTGLHPREFIETRRHWFTGTVPHDTRGTVHVLNLVEGREAIVESPNSAFAPMLVHYAETFIIPASVGPYTIRPHGEAEGCECATMKAYVRSGLKGFASV